ncbi:hydroxymyristoyl-ACP dehydratase [Kosmotoga arenicorallina S304]|uniref:3-hydroxyacyl-[acyl-carrier-protein] dehydratase n=1 Tax=Kosmotoga arenicorallina S304 TaxID=1453497 RepID=A0A176JZE7_9BACT|nr:3-hydroxyacyl-ACP dehydratase FabZ [Kosmotoga arenicorallina]OAA29447.1 hydroxymyristoyl-ACP dehydratase [Kosmotoga arenicorallina S304]
MKGAEYVKSIIPHRPPFLLVDGVIEEGEDNIKAFRDIRPEDPVFQGHFPDYPIYPGVLIVEGLAQAAGVLLLNGKKGVPLFLGIEKARFRGEVKPGDRLHYEVKILQKRRGVIFADCVAMVNNKKVCTATLMLGFKEA